jgi:hypothetical protein
MTALLTAIAIAVLGFARTWLSNAQALSYLIGHFRKARQMATSFMRKVNAEMFPRVGGSLGPFATR